jgi:hypothetical protein
MPTDWTAVGAIATGAGVIATAAGAAIVYWQLSDAKLALYGTNSYAFHKDLIDAYDHVLDAKDTFDGQDPAALKVLKRQVRRFDALIETGEGLHNNGGLSDDSWKQVLSTTCPASERDNYQIEKIDLHGIKLACDRGQKFWRGNAR